MASSNVSRMASTSTPAFLRAAGLGARVNTRAKERLANVNVAKPGQSTLIEQKALDGGTRAVEQIR
jgi:hypothetical protein